MEKNTNNLFVNDGSFLERFKQLQQQQQQQQQQQEVPATAATEQGNDEDGEQDDYTRKAPPEMSKSGFSVKKTNFVSSSVLHNKSSSQQTKAQSSSSNGKLAFSLKPKSRSVINPLKLGDDDDEDDENNEEKTENNSERFETDLHSRSKKLTTGSNHYSMKQKDSIPPPPSDLEVKKVADKLAHFVAKNGRQFEDLTRRKNSDNPLFRFLFDVESTEYKYYDYCVTIEEKALGTEVNVNGGNVTTSQSSQHSPRRGSQSSSYQMPPSALYGSNESQSAGSLDSVSMMEFYMKKAAAEDMRKPHKRSRDEMPPPPSLHSPSPSSKKGHHMGDYIPQEELEKFLAKCNSQQYSGETERAKIQPDNVGHRLLSKMGWKEGEGLGSGKGGRADPVEAGSVKVNNLGVGAAQPGEVSAEDDIYEQYKKRMMLGYRYRPNPLNNPRKAYY